MKRLRPAVVSLLVMFASNVLAQPNFFDALKQMKDALEKTAQEIEKQQSQTGAPQSALSTAQGTWTSMGANNEGQFFYFIDNRSTSAEDRRMSIKINVIGEARDSAKSRRLDLSVNCSDRTYLLTTIKTYSEGDFGGIEKTIASPNGTTRSKPQPNSLGNQYIDLACNTQPSNTNVPAVAQSLEKSEQSVPSSRQCIALLKRKATSRSEDNAIQIARTNPLTKYRCNDRLEGNLSFDLQIRNEQVLPFPYPEYQPGSYSVLRITGVSPNIGKISIKIESDGRANVYIEDDITSVASFFLHRGRYEFEGHSNQTLTVNERERKININGNIAQNLLFEKQEKPSNWKSPEAMTYGEKNNFPGLLGLVKDADDLLAACVMVNRYALVAAKGTRFNAPQAQMWAACKVPEIQSRFAEAGFSEKVDFWRKKLANNDAYTYIESYTPVCTRQFPIITDYYGRCIGINGKPYR